MKFLKTLITVLASVALLAGVALADKPEGKPSDHQPIWPEMNSSHGRIATGPRVFERHAPDGVFNTATTTNWSGYVVNSGPYWQVSGRWQVPAAKWGNTNSNPYNTEYNTMWIGIGGFNDGTLIQLGTETTVSSSGVVTHYTWYELYPAVSVNIGQPVSSGDIMTSEIKCTANCTPGATQTWVMTLSNTTKGWNWSKTVQFASSMVSAEWVVESPYYNGFLPLNDYGKANWDSALANGANQNLNSSANGLALNDAAGQTSNPSEALNGNQFSTCYGWGVFTPCTVGSIGGGSPPPPPPPLLAATLSASPNKLIVGQSATLSWGSVAAASCTGSGFNTGGATSGSATVAPSVTTSYGVSCTGSGGTANAATSVQVSTTTCHGKNCR